MRYVRIQKKQEKKGHNRNVILNISYLHNQSVCAQRGVNLILNCCVVFNIQQYNVDLLAGHNDEGCPDKTYICMYISSSIDATKKEARLYYRDNG